MMQANHRQSLAELCNLKLVILRRYPIGQLIARTPTWPNVAYSSNSLITFKSSSYERSLVNSEDIYFVS